MSGEHGCDIDWCDQGNSPEEPHWCQIAYTPATMDWIAPEVVSVEGWRFPTVGTGIRWDEHTGVPSIYVHISGAATDVDAYMRPDEAEAFLGSLQDACRLVRETLCGGHRLTKGSQDG